MIIFNISGGLGNQFFQYAFGRYLALKNRTDLYLRFNTYEYDVSRSSKLSHFQTCFKRSSVEDVRKYSKTYHRLHPLLKKLYRNSPNVSLKRYFTDRIETGFHKEFKKVTRGYFDGYWAYEEYFKEIRSSLLKELELKDEHKTDIYKLMEMQLSGSRTVAVHIRRGDYISNQKYAGIMHNLSLAYYYSAIEFLRSKKDDLKFYIFSDEIDWVRQNFRMEGIDCHFMDNPGLCSDYLEFSLMKSCANFIIANSTFSWWAAWLSESRDKCVVAPKKWYKNEEMQHCYEKRNMIPSNWIKLYARN